MTTPLPRETRVVHGHRRAFVRAGEGPPLLLLHGWPEFWLTWAPVMERLADRFELIAPDLRGFGTSDKPSLVPSTDAGPDVQIIATRRVEPWMVAARRVKDRRATRTSGQDHGNIHDLGNTRRRGTGVHRNC